MDPPVTPYRWYSPKQDREAIFARTIMKIFIFTLVFKIIAVQHHKADKSRFLIEVTYVHTTNTFLEDAVN